MRLWVRLLLGGEEEREKRNVLWNMLGSAIYALSSTLLGALVTRFLGAGAGGIFFFAFSTFGQQMFIVAYFGMRPLQVTDAAEKYSFADYLRFRRMSCAAAIALTAAYALLFSERGEARIVLFLMAFYKVLDGYADCYESEFQRRGRLYLAGKSSAFRTLLSLSLFFAALLRTESLTAACAAAFAGQLAGLFLFCRLPLSALDGVNLRLRRGSAAGLCHAAKWLFLAAFLDLYIFAASKFAVNELMTNAESGYYTTIFIPTSVINLMSGFVIRPVLTTLAEARERGRRREFLAAVQKILLLIVLLTLAALAAAAAFGIPALSLLVGPEAGRALRPYRTALLLIISGGGFYAALNLLYYVLVILEAQRVIFGIYGFGAALAWALSGRMTARFGLNGAAASYLLTMVILTVLFAAAALFGERGDEKLRGGLPEPQGDV